jgi:hypothetical protein
MLERQMFFSPKSQPKTSQDLVMEIIKDAEEAGERRAKKFSENIDREYSGLKVLGKNTLLELYDKYWVQIDSNNDCCNATTTVINSIQRLIGETHAFNAVLKKNSSHHLDDLKPVLSQLDTISKDLVKILSKHYSFHEELYFKWCSVLYESVNKINFAVHNCILHVKEDITVKCKKDALEEIFALRKIIAGEEKKSGVRQGEPDEIAEEKQPGAISSASMK